jgi:hypothetical protein
VLQEIPQRYQLSRRPGGAQLPEGTVNVARPTMWGNPWKVVASGGLYLVEGPGQFFCPAEDYRPDAHVFAVRLYREWLDSGTGAPALLAAGPKPDLEQRRQRIVQELPTLVGRHVACWCPTELACHGGILLRRAKSLAAG